MHAPAPIPHLAAVLALAGGMLAGCATLGPRIEPPGVTVEGVRLDRMESVDAWFVAAVRLSNPNDRDVTVERLDASLRIEGQPVATAALVAPVTVPAHASAPASIRARTGMDAVLRANAAAMRRGEGTSAVPSLRYELAGEAKLAGGLAVPFRRSGEVGNRKDAP
jgi:LEA14-like dessication related protein